MLGWGREREPVTYRGRYKRNMELGGAMKPGRSFELCAVNSLTIMNTCCVCAPVGMEAPGNQAAAYDWLCAGQWQLCLDVGVCRSACCWTDHYMVRGKVQLQLPRMKKSVACAPLAVHPFSSEEPREEFQQSLNQCTRLKKCIMGSAEECVGWAKKKPDWFSDSINTLVPLQIAKKDPTVGVYILPPLLPEL